MHRHNAIWRVEDNTVSLLMTWRAVQRRRIGNPVKTSRDAALHNSPPPDGLA